MMLRFWQNNHVITMCFWLRIFPSFQCGGSDGLHDSWCQNRTFILSLRPVSRWLSMNDAHFGTSFVSVNFSVFPDILVGLYLFSTHVYNLTVWQLFIVWNVDAKWYSNDDNCVFRLSFLSYLQFVTLGFFIVHLTLLLSTRSRLHKFF